MFLLSERKSCKKIGILITLSFLIVLSIVILPGINVASTYTNLFAQNNSIELTEQHFLERFVGEWEGKGQSDNNDVQDLMQFQWVLNQRFLSFSYKALAGDNYEGEGYVWYNPSLSLYEWWEFNNGRWPVRKHQGQHNDNQLVLEEHTEDRDMRLTFTFANNDTLDMTEGFLNGEQLDAYVAVKFRRKVGETR
jgi:hypothetical protein